MKEDGACNTGDIRKMHTKFNSENLKEREIKHNTKCSDDIRCIS
jgi:hypothetical protein